MFLSFLIDFPELDGVGVAGEQFEVLALWRQPIDMLNLFVDVDTLQGVELSLVGLKLEVIVILLRGVESI